VSRAFSVSPGQSTGETPAALRATLRLAPSVALAARPPRFARQYPRRRRAPRAGRCRARRAGRAECIKKEEEKETEQAGGLEKRRGGVGGKGKKDASIFLGDNETLNREYRMPLNT